MRLKFFGLLVVFGFKCFSQQKLSLHEAENQLIKNNLQLVAQQYDIDVAKAKIIQAKVWQQPLISGEVNLINPDENSYFNAGASGQKAFAIQQLIYLGGKKKNEVAFAKSNAELAELQFEQVLSNLKYQLAQNFFGLYFDTQKNKVLTGQIEKLQSLLDSYNVQVKKGNISLKDLVRLQTLLLSFQNERNEIAKELITKQQNLALLTGNTAIIDPQVDEKKLLENYGTVFLDQENLKQQVFEKNPEYLWAKKLTDNQSLYLKWQQSLNVPDVTMGGAYDQSGGAFKNQVNLTFAIPLPLWKQNKGNVSAAKAQLKQSTTNLDFKKQEFSNRVSMSYLIWKQQEQQYKGVTADMKTDLELVYQGIVSNFQKSNVTLLEFTDFLESYNQAVMQQNEIKMQWINAGLEINYLTNNEIFKY